MTKFLRFSLLLAAFASTPALAGQDVPAERRVIVSTADLNLASARGQTALDRRLVHAVIEACGSTSDADLAGQNEIRRCREETSSRIAARRGQLVKQASRGSEIILAARSFPVPSRERRLRPPPSHAGRQGLPLVSVQPAAADPADPPRDDRGEGTDR